MATIAVRSQSMDTLQRFVGNIFRRAKRLPRGWELGTPDRLATFHQSGGRQQVTPRMQKAIAAKIGPGAKPPKVGKIMVHPRRPVRVSGEMAGRAVASAAKHIILGSPLGVEKAMRSGVGVQFQRGGPGWKPSRDWGNLQARRPTLGGRGGRVARGWDRAAFRELR